jgi:peptidoglycan/xylan/chitin deacetylase (PgdA/CDA1 family)
VARALPPLVLAYHAVGSVPLRRDPHRLFTRPAALTRQVRRLRSWGYRFATVGELARRVADGGGAGYVALSFDDGFADDLGALLPTLRVPATMFPVTGWLGGAHPHAPRARMLTAAELRSLSDAGIEIGGHTLTHPDLTTLAFDEALRELVECRRQLERIVDAPVEVAAYPWGTATAETHAACAAAGYRAAVRTSGQGSWEDPYELPRQQMLNGSTLAGLRLKRDDRYERLMARRPLMAAQELRMRLCGNRRPA